jgi:hypothetical protein
MKHKYSILCLFIAAAYVGGYLVLSLCGAYMPATYGTNGIKDWAWTPRGFADQSGRWRIGLFVPFFPLWWIDSRYWHNDWTGLSGPQKMPTRPNKVGRTRGQP